MAEKNNSKKLNPQIQKWLPVGIVLLLAVIFVLARHIILTNRAISRRFPKPARRHRRSRSNLGSRWMRQRSAK